MANSENAARSHLILAGEPDLLVVLSTLLRPSAVVEEPASFSMSFSSKLFPVVSSVLRGVRQPYSNGGGSNQAVDVGAITGALVDVIVLADWGGIIGSGGAGGIKPFGTFTFVVPFVSRGVRAQEQPVEENERPLSIPASLAVVGRDE